MKLAITYALLAAIATITNLGSQDLTLHLYAGVYSVQLSVLVGTGVGLVVKYMLDKVYIFRFQARNAIEDGQTFVLYTLTGVITTAIFWGFEFWFDALFQSKEWRYVGGAIGLAIGYVAKYQLDKKFVFGNRVARC
ncbi:GtrA family protein [Noviherbaspirillum massiliense]|uniref:GtrA family protein n=1 Tax=Noviherbaspirillum massiliense TaxID=1465823 RepID=UPI0002DD3337|nr:GtrA family protein [Noviherbaspirillum massiliense]